MMICLGRGAYNSFRTRWRTTNVTSDEIYLVAPVEFKFRMGCQLIKHLKLTANYLHDTSRIKFS